MNKKVRWKDSEVETLRLMLEEGKTTYEIARALKRSSKAVRAMKNRKGFKLDEETSIRRRTVENRIQFTEDELKAIKSDWEKMNIRDCAEKHLLGVTTLTKLSRRERWGDKKRIYKPSKPQFSFQLVYDLYYLQCLGIKTISKTLGCSDRRFYRSLESHGLARMHRDDRIKLRQEEDSKKIIRYSRNINELREEVKL